MRIHRFLACITGLAVSCLPVATAHAAPPPSPPPPPVMTTSDGTVLTLSSVQPLAAAATSQAATSSTGGFVYTYVAPASSCSVVYTVQYPDSPLPGNIGGYAMAKNNGCPRVSWTHQLQRYTTKWVTVASRVKSVGDGEEIDDLLWWSTCSRGTFYTVNNAIVGGPGLFTIVECKP